jgi:F-type H+-transporting ATPase subunit b
MRSLLLSITVDFDKSAFLQMALFAILVLVLKPVLLDPMLALFAAREAGTDGVRGDAREMQEKAADILRRYDSELAAARARATAARDALRKETSELEAKILDAGRQAAAAAVDAGQKQIQDEVKGLRAEMDASRPALARSIASQILGREVQQ